MAPSLNPDFALGRGIRRRKPDFFFLKKFVRCPYIDLTFFVAVEEDGVAVLMKNGASAPRAMGAPKVSASFVSVLTPNAKSGLKPCGGRSLPAPSV
jgi:hypothetical protein